MIISHKYKYIFVQMPHTASTVIGDELIKFYGGEHILEKHSFLPELQSTLPPIYRSYFVFAAVRNPMDEKLTMYKKITSNHLGLYEGKPHDSSANAGGSVARTFRKIHVTKGLSFEEYLRVTSLLPYVNPISLNQRRYDFVMRYENLNGDFDTVLDKLGMTKQRQLPWRNKTVGKRVNFLDDYSPASMLYAERGFKGFMHEWGYDIPEDWDDISYFYSLKYKLAKIAKRIFWFIKRK